MSIIQKIRDKAAIVLTTMISISLIAFLVQDAFVGGNNSLFDGQPSSVGSINGKDVDPAAVPRGEIDLRGERVFERRGEGADVGQQRRVHRRSKRPSRGCVSRDHRDPSGSEERATGKDLGVASGGTHRDLA
jgi:hypothetical protein